MRNMRSMTNPRRLGARKVGREVTRRRMRALGIFKARKPRGHAPVLSKGPFGLPILEDASMPNGVVVIKRTGGPFNYPYGPRPGAKASILAVHERGARQALSGAIATPPLDYEAMTRDELRSLAKHLGLSGYGRLNKAGLIAAIEASRS